MLKKIVAVVSMVSLLLVGIFIWPSLYSYHPASDGVGIIRVHRFTHEASLLTDQGWKKLTANPAPEFIRISSASIVPEQRKK
jgi:hypothetical protein